jgi:hypothetical protein
MALRKKDETSSSRHASQEQILLSLSAAEPTSGMQGTLTRAERDPCDASHGSGTGGFSDLCPSFGGRPRVSQQWIWCLTQTEARQALGKLGEVHRELGIVRVSSTLALLCGRYSGLRFAWHSCIASEKKFSRTSGSPASASRMTPKKRQTGGSYDFAGFGTPSHCFAKS